ncbi:MAG TPA: glycosyltransferase family 4 protein [Steroidobacteraceae bacterium]|nr:glycosyltransferase family 4 protein [Steroidobacteraceae bacterium]
MKVAVLVPGGVDRSGEYRVIPALLALIARLARVHELHVFALAQEPHPDTWPLGGATIHNIGGRWRVPRAVMALRAEHRRAPFALVHAIWSGPVGLAAVLAARVLGVPSAVHLTGGEVVSYPEIAYGALRWRRWRLIEPRVLRAADEVSATSEPIVAAAARFGVRPRRVPLGVSLDDWPRREPAMRDARGTARLLHVASLNRVKDQPTLLRALQRVAAAGVDFHLDVVGDDVLHGEIQTLARQFGLSPRITFHGFLTQRALRPLVEAAHVHVFCSRHEAGPFVLLEAAVAGVPSVGTSVGHVTEWPADAIISVPVGAPEELARGILRLLHDEPLRLQVARAAQDRATREDANHTAACFLDMYSRLVAR